MKNLLKIISLSLLLCMLVSVFASCGKTDDGSNNDDTANPPAGDNGGDEGSSTEPVDYVSNLKLDMTSSTLKQEVDVKLFIDGDTTHFDVPHTVSANGILKARYLAVNTPESTGKIEEWGKTASNFTKEKLSSAVSIMIESDDSNWNVDSTGSRHLVWVWYKPSADADYRNLNLELLQNGLAKPSNAGGNRYGETCMSAIAQAKVQKLHIYSGAKDPNFYYGKALEMSIKELRLNIESYNGSMVAFDAFVVSNSGDNGVYVQNYDADTDRTYGVYVYYGTSVHPDVLSMLTPGNKVHIVGTVSEFNGTYQVSGLEYNPRNADSTGNTYLIEEDCDIAYQLTDPADFVNGKVNVNVTVTDEEGNENDTTVEYAYAALATATAVEMKGLTVKSLYTTANGGDSDGSISITCEANGVTLTVRTSILQDADGKIVTEDYFRGKTIDVKGIVDYYNGYQVKVFSLKNITVYD